MKFNSLNNSLNNLIHILKRYIIISADGSSAALIQPVLDSQFGQKNINGNYVLDQKLVTNKTKEQAVAIIRDAFISAAERDIYCGDSVTINIITKDGIKVEQYPLRKD